MFRAILLTGLILTGLYACNSPKLNKAEAALDDFSGAIWITDTIPLPQQDSLFYLDNPAPIFRKEFNVKKEIKSAKLFITAAGYYHATINGGKTGKNYLEPAWTNFAKRVYYSEYDITENLIKGKNCIAVSLGNGFYNPLPMKMWGNRNLRETLPVGKPQFIARLKLEYANEKTKNIRTDPSWKFSYGPILKNNVYLGEV